MCQSQADGGQRCASHARTRLHKAQDAAVAADDAYQQSRRRKNRKAALEAHARLRDAEADYASTTEGREHYFASLKEAREAGDIAAERTLIETLAEGERRRHANKQRREQNRDAAARAERQAVGYAVDITTAKSPQHAKVLVASANHQAAMDRIAEATRAGDERAVARAWDEAHEAKREQYEAECAFARTPVGREHYETLARTEPRGSLPQQHGEYILAMSVLGQN